MASIFYSAKAFSQSVKTLEYNLGLGTFTGLLPFDQPFNLKLINITNTPDSISVRLMELPKKDYNKISKYKKNNRSDWKVVTAKDVYDWHPDNSYSFMLDTMIQGGNLNDTFCSLSVPFYLKPESKYLIDVKSFVKTELSDAETAALETFIKKSRLFQSTMNELIRPNIMDPNSSASQWASNSERLQNIAQQIVKARNGSYVITNIEPVQQLRELSTFLIGFNRINLAITQLGNLAANNRNLAPQTLLNVRKRDTSLLTSLQGINWIKIQINDNDYTGAINSVNDVLRQDSLLLNAADNSQITFTRDNIKQALDAAIRAKEAFINIFAYTISQHVVGQSVIASTNSESMAEQAKLHVTFDLGYAYVGQIDRGNAYAGLNIYFRSIDTSLPLKNYRLKFWDFVGSRTSLLIGASVQSIQKDSVRKGLLSNEMALVTGIGFRLLPWFKINGGAYMYYLYSRNPLRTKNDYSFKASPFISLSIDFNISTFLETFGNGNLTNIFKK